MKYPTGVENHGGKLRIWFVYKDVRVRENLGVPDTAKNRRVAGELRSSVCYAIKTGVFDYAKQFPSGFAPIFPDICYHLTHYKPAA
ncbi:Arm DNA-binding domain-containing protein, partial [Escherichia coli]